MSVDVPFPENKIPLQGFVFIQAIFQKMAWINTKERQSAMSEIFKKTYTVAEPGCGLTVFSMEGSEINLFGSRTVIKTSGEDFFEPIKDFLHEKLVEEKADTMYYISMVDTAVLGVLGGICIVVGVVGAFLQQEEHCLLPGWGVSWEEPPFRHTVIRKRWTVTGLPGVTGAGVNFIWREQLRNFRGQQREPWYLQGCLPERI